MRGGRIIEQPRLSLANESRVLGVRVQAALLGAAQLVTRYLSPAGPGVVCGSGGDGIIFGSAGQSSCSDLK